jgi:hypothetical protein
LGNRASIYLLKAIFPFLAGCSWDMVASL